MLSRISGRTSLIPIPLAEVARAALNGEHLTVRQWAADCARERTVWASVPCPRNSRKTNFAWRLQLSSCWQNELGRAPCVDCGRPASIEAIYFVPARMRRSRAISEQSGPTALRRRHIFAMPDYLIIA